MYVDSDENNFSNNPFLNRNIKTLKGMKYRLVPRVNPLDRSKVKYYATPVIDGNISKADLTKEVAAISSMSRGDVSNVMEGVRDVTPKYVKISKSITIGELGTLRISFTSEGVDNPDDFNVSMIKGVKYVFTPSKELRLQLNDMHFERVD
jgi:predicted histone-like DNA-binding protein